MNLRTLRTIARSKQWTSHSRLVLALLVVSVVANGALFYHYHQPRDKAQQEVETITRDLTKTTVLPPGKPAILTVVDKNKLTNRTIAASVKNGDKLLVYQQSNKIVVYRPDTKKLVTIFNLTTDPSPIR